MAVSPTLREVKMDGKYTAGTAKNVRVAVLLFRNPVKGFTTYQFLAELYQQGIPFVFDFVYRPRGVELDQTVIVIRLPLDQNADAFLDFLLEKLHERYNYTLVRHPRLAPAEADRYAADIQNALTDSTEPFVE